MSTQLELSGKYLCGIGLQLHSCVCLGEVSGRVSVSEEPSAAQVASQVSRNEGTIQAETSGDCVPQGRYRVLLSYWCSISDTQGFGSFPPQKLCQLQEICQSSLGRGGLDMCTRVATITWT